MPLEKCFPAKNRKKKGQSFRCKVCWIAHCTELTQSDKLLAKKRSKEKKDLKMKAKIVNDKKVVKAKALAKEQEDLKAETKTNAAKKAKAKAKKVLTLGPE
jgi:hypothetical protein